MPAKCSVCRKAAQYTCPRCDAAYCRLDCYQKHSSRCTESFYRESTMDELKSVTATHAQKEEMIDILRRLHVQAAEQEGSGGPLDGESSSSEEGGLSEATVHRLLAKAAATGGDFDVTDEDLSPEDLEAFHRELAAGKLSRAIERWEPWWLSQEAAELELGPSGTRLVAAVEPEGQAGGAGVRSMGGLPAPPTTPLLPLSALIKGEPSPHLLATLLDLLYAYCLVLRLFNGDYRADLAGATDTVLALSAGLSSAAAPNSTPQLALLGCVERAHRLPATGGSGFGISVLRDVVAVLRRGRPVVLTALMDLSRLLDAGRQEVKAAQDPQDKPAAAWQLLRAAQRKLLFFLSWANERPMEAYALLAAQAESFLQEQEATRRKPEVSFLATELTGGE